MHELKETQVERQFLLRNAAMGPQPGAQQRPEAFGGVDVDLMEAIAIVVAGIFASAVAHGVMVETPFRQSVVNGVPSEFGKNRTSTRLDRIWRPELTFTDLD